MILATIWMNLYELSRISKLIETGSRVAVGRKESLLSASGCGVSFGGEESVIKVDCSDCTAL